MILIAENLSLWKIPENKPVEWFQKHKFEKWHSGEVLKQLQEKDF